MSPRPKRSRKLKEPPHITGFIPENEEFNPEDVINLLYEEFEALKLADYDHLSQLEASRILEVSRPTFTRIYDAALKKIAKALVEQKRLVIGGGNVVFNERWFLCRECESVFKEKSAVKKTGNEDGEDQIICPVCGSENIIEIQDANFSKGWHRQHGHHGGHRFGRGLGSEGNCICPKCDFTIKHEPGVPCNSHLCPHCHIRMIREGSAHHLDILKKKNKK